MADPPAGPRTPASFSTGGVRPSLQRAVARPPLVSVAIPAYNRPELLRATLASLAAQEDFDDFEVVICDDLGLPATRKVVQAAPLPRLRYFINPQRLGAVANWNQCVRLCRGTWVTVLHEDDLLYPWYFARAVPHLHRSVAGVAMRCVQGAVPAGLPRPGTARRPRRYRPTHFLKSGLTPFPGVLFARKIGLQIGGFDERQGPLADYDFWYRLGCAKPVLLLPEVGAFYRVSDSQWTATAWPEMLRKMHLLRLRIAREQLPQHRRLGRWMARFFTYRNARCYERRFGTAPAVLARTSRFRRIFLQRIPSGWVWQLLRCLDGRKSLAASLPVSLRTVTSVLCLPLRRFTRHASLSSVGVIWVTWSC